MAGHSIIKLDGSSLTLEKFRRIVSFGEKITISRDAIKRVSENRKVIEKAIGDGRRIYGVNTGFGELQDRIIGMEEARRLQLNLVRSTAAGIGDPLSTEEVRGMMLLRINTLLKAHSGVRPELVELMVEMLNRGVNPVIPSRGSVGASGDLAPLAHMALVIVGEGEAEFRGEIMDGESALRAAKLKPLELHEKEGLALINGTQLMTSIGALSLIELKKLIPQSAVIFSISLQALDGNLDAFDSRIFDLRNHRGSAAVAELVRKSCRGWKKKGRNRLQDAYTLRCYPQIVGPLLEMMSYAEEVIVREMNSTNDNPIVFSNGDIISAGNFHGEPVAVALDALCIPLQVFISYTERRIARLLDSKLSGLSPFLAANPGLDSGYMIAQYTAASLVGEGNVLSHPASSHSVPTSANQEDFVSMGAYASLKLKRMTDLAFHEAAIEALVASQALELSGQRPSYRVKQALKNIRASVPPLKEDRPLQSDIETCVSLLRNECI